MSKAIRREIPAGRDPLGLAASVLYLSSINNTERITQADLAKAAGVTEVTQKRSKGFTERAD
jgi:transcription initiation factor TFIIB